MGSYKAAYDTVKQLRETIAQTPWNTASEVITTVINEYQRSLAQQSESSVGNMVRRVLKIVKEEYHSCGKAKTEEQDTQESLQKLLLADESEEKHNISKPGLRDAILDSIDELIGELETCGDIVTGNPQDYINGGDVIMTLGFSRLVYQFIKKAASKDKKLQVVIAEGAPSCKGHQLAASLTKLEVQTSLIPDAAMFALMSRCNKVVISTQAVLADGGLKAKSGSHALALAAKHYSIPVIVLAPVYKITPEYLRSHEPDAYNEIGSPEQVLPYKSGEIIDCVNITNPLYDFVPPSLVTLYITNIGGYSPPYIYRLLADLYHHEDYDLGASVPSAS